ncbi:MAG: polysaccharide deacetylase family protein [Blastocatellia bacterium]|nr:polysaccharide deacetylase family protein [Blastocatellia bacterium]
MLTVVMYHYVRDLPRTRYPEIRGMLLDQFRGQVDRLRAEFEMATLESTLAFLRNEYRPARPLCLLTFDDGLKEHYSDVAGLLAEREIQGLFFAITSCIEEQRVASVHMNHFLTAALGFDLYRQLFLRRLPAGSPSIEEVDPEAVKRAYRWDAPEAGAFKYLFNFLLRREARDEVVRALFTEHLGDEAEFSQELYFNWAEAREMQAAGMVIGGHSHEHPSLGTLTDAQQRDDLTNCRRALDRNLRAQTHWPFCYPYGKRASFNATTIGLLRELGYDCAFTTEVGENAPGADLFTIQRFDCKER